MASVDEPIYLACRRALVRVLAEITTCHSCSLSLSSRSGTRWIKRDQWTSLQRARHRRLDRSRDQCRANEDARAKFNSSTRVTYISSEGGNLPVLGRDAVRPSVRGVVHGFDERAAHVHD